MTITFIGHGYVGLVTAAVFADLGNTVWIVGRTPEKITALKNGIMPFYEPGLEEMVKRNLKAGRIRCTTSYAEGIADSEVIFIAVGTPPKTTGEADLSSVYAAARSVGQNLKKYGVVVTKSTVPPGTNKEVGKIIQRYKPKNVTFDIASAPEFLREGSALSDTSHPDRVVIGTESQKAQKILINLHKPIDGKLVLTNIETAEMIKYASNSLLSTKISFANAIAFICEKVGADVEKVLEGVGLDRRLGREFLYPGVGYGGSCFPKDVKALIAIAKKHGYKFELLQAVDKINHQAATNFVEKIKHNLQKLKGKNIGVLGLAFKPNTDDMREAPSIIIIRALVKLGAKITAYDPIAQTNTQKIITNIHYSDSIYNCAKNMDALLVLTEWSEFKQLDLDRIKKLMRSPIIFDGRNIYDPQTMKQLGIKYFSIGRK